MPEGRILSHKKKKRKGREDGGPNWVGNWQNDALLSGECRHLKKVKRCFVGYPSRDDKFGQMAESSSATHACTHAHARAHARREVVKVDTL